MNLCYPFVNTHLPYAYNALEPYIDEKTMELQPRPPSSGLY